MGKHNDYELERHFELKRGLTYQRERFKEARVNWDFDTMKMCLENIKSDIKYKAEKNNLANLIIKIEKILKWYENIESKYTKNTPEGKRVVLPQDINFKINRVFSAGYEILMSIQDELELI